MSEIFETKPNFFIGNEVEKTIHYGKRTLFVNGDVEIEGLVAVKEYLCGVTQVYLGASKTHRKLLDNTHLFCILEYLKLFNVGVTIECEYEDVSWYKDILDRFEHVCLNIPLSMDPSIIERVSVKIEPPEPFKDGIGVYCMIPNSDNFTAWGDYSDDKIIFGRWDI